MNVLSIQTEYHKTAVDLKFLRFGLISPSFRQFLAPSARLISFGSCAEVVIQRMSLLDLGLSQRKVSLKVAELQPLARLRLCSLPARFTYPQRKEALISKA